MALKRKKDGSNPNTILVLFLVFFVILSIGLGVWGYYAQAGQEKLKEAAVEAEKKATAAREGEKFALYVAREGRQALGHSALEQDDLGQLQTGRQEFQTGGYKTREKEKPAIEVMVAGIQKDLEANKQFGNNYKEIVTRLRSELNKTQTELADERRTAKEESAKLQAVQTKYDVQWKNALKMIDASGAKALAAAVAKSAEMEEMFKRNTELQGKFDKLTEESEIAVAKEKAETKKLSQQITKMKDQSANFAIPTSGGQGQEQHALLLDVSKGKTLWDAPLGKIVRVEADGRTVNINLGSAEGVKPQLSFNVFAVGKEGRADGSLKGTIEVTRVLGPNSSQARLTSLYDLNGQEIALNDPAIGRLQREASNTIKEGDLLFNMAFGTHVVVAGEIRWGSTPTDNPAEQQRNLNNFMALLSRQGVVIDGYLDLTNAEFKGSFTDKTRFMIRGDFLLEEKEAPKRVKDINETIRAVRKDASEKGAFIISAENFANVIGYREPRHAGSIDTGAFRPTLPAAGSGVGVLRIQADPGAPPPAPKEDMKEEMKKDDAKEKDAK